MLGAEVTNDQENSTALGRLSLAGRAKQKKMVYYNTMELTKAGLSGATFSRAYQENRRLAYCPMHAKELFCDANKCKMRKLFNDRALPFCAFHKKKNENGHLTKCNIDTCTYDAEVDHCLNHDLQMLKFNDIRTLPSHTYMVYSVNNLGNASINGGGKCYDYLSGLTLKGKDEGIKFSASPATNAIAQPKQVQASPIPSGQMTITQTKQISYNP